MCEVSRILNIYKRLNIYDDLTPRDEVNKVFSELVDICLNTCSTKSCEILNNENVRKILKSLNRICSSGEYCLEGYWAKRFLEQDNIQLDEFIYYKNYLDLSHEEYFQFQKNSKKILFVGSGPLPMTAVVLVKQYGLSVDCIDIDFESIEISKKLIDKIGFTDKIKFIHTDILDFYNFDDYGNIILAALVGEDSIGKNEIINHIINNTQDSQRLIIRSSENLKTLLYPSVDVSKIKKRFKYIVPTNKQVVNSFLVA